MDHIDRDALDAKIETERQWLVRSSQRVTGTEGERVEREHPHSLAFRFVTGFPPRYFVRLDPR